VWIFESLLNGVLPNGIAVFSQLVGHAFGPVLIVHFQHEQAGDTLRVGEVEDAIRDDAGAVGKVDLVSDRRRGLVVLRLAPVTSK
jgi:hypothetical protein